MSGSLEVTFAEAALGTERSMRVGGGSKVEVVITSGVETGARMRVSGHGAPAASKGGGRGARRCAISDLRKLAPVAGGKKLRAALHTKSQSERSGSTRRTR